MYPDPARVKRSDPGNPDICNVFAFHKVYGSPEWVKRVDVDCRRAAIGCVGDKKKLAETLLTYLAPIRARRDRYLQSPHLVEEILEDGCRQAREIAVQTMEEVRNAMKI